MTTAWIILLLAGLLEIAWAHSIRLTAGFTRPIPVIICAVLTIAVLGALSFAMRTLPVGTAYAVFVGIGAVGTVLVGILVLREPITPVRALACVMIIGGVALLRLTEPGGPA